MSARSTTASPMMVRPLKRIGILFGRLDKLNLPALQYLILCLNPIQRTFQYEFYPCDFEHDLLQTLRSNARVNRQGIKDRVPAFLESLGEYLRKEIELYRTQERLPDYFIIYTITKFDDEYYTTRQNGLSIIALGDWERWMAPPSILEFFLTLTLRESVAAVSPSLSGSIHLGTKGCLCDFTRSIEEVRQKVLHGFVCDFCRQALDADRLPQLADELTDVLKKEWLGRPRNPHSPASVISKLNFNLFTTKGLEPTFWEGALNTLRKEGVKQLIEIIGAIALLLLLLFLGLKEREGGGRAGGEGGGVMQQRAK
jgi:hypothetical protein